MDYIRRAVWSVLLIPALLGCIVAALPARAAEENMTTVYLVLLKKGPAWTAEDTPETKAIQKAHMEGIDKLWRAGKLIVAGPTEDADLRGIFVFKAASISEAKILAASDPAVQAKRLEATVYPWWVEKRALPEGGSYCTPSPGK